MASLPPLRALALFATTALLAAGCGDTDPAQPAASVTSVSKPARSYSAEYLRDYFTLLCTVSKSTPGCFPPQVARAYGYVGIANYEAVVAGIPGGRSLAGQINGLTSSMLPKADSTVEYNWAIASNAATAETIRKMYERKITAANLQAVDSMERATLASLSTGVAQPVVDRSTTYGKAVAAAVYTYSTSDGGHESYLDPFQLPYAIPTDSGCWVPTGALATPVAPRWGENRPFMQVNVSNTMITPPLPFSSDPSSQFYAQANAVYTQVKNNTFDEVEIAKYWADDPFNTCTPTGHTFNILTQLLLEDRATLEKSAVAYAMLCVAENDAFITCWRSKYQYVLIRPVSYIKQHIDPTFATVIGTPAFPAYTSGHSCEIGAAARVFTRLFTDGSGNYPFTDYSQLQYGFPARNYNNFEQMAEECANSRFYAGIHYPMDNQKGLQTGRAVGDNVNYRIEWPQNIQ